MLNIHLLNCMKNQVKKLSDNLYFHGTSNEANARMIMKEGILPDISKTQELARPVDGRIYAAVHLKDAIPYMLGGAMAGHEIPKEWIKESRYSYMFIIKIENLENIQPDEDQVGQAIHDADFSWTERYSTYLMDLECIIDEGEDSFYHNLFEQIKAGEYEAWIAAGHALLPRLNNEEKQDIIRKYGNIAHLGSVHPLESWKFDKLKSPLLKEDGSNFFELAEKVD
jgi:hypothetical protein